MTDYGVFRGEKSCLVFGVVEGEEEWKCERAV